jgi:hypothetical protein
LTVKKPVSCFNFILNVSSTIFLDLKATAFTVACD